MSSDIDKTRIKSEGYDEFAVSLDNLDVHIGEKGSSEIVRGIAARFKDLSVEISGFDMYTTSNVLGGSGISSSAAFETLIATAIDSYYNNNQIGAVEIAKIGQYAENFYLVKLSVPTARGAVCGALVRFALLSVEH